MDPNLPEVLRIVAERFPGQRVRIERVIPKPCYCIILSDDRCPDRIRDFPDGLHRRITTRVPSKTEIEAGYDRAIHFLALEIQTVRNRIDHAHTQFQTWTSPIFRSRAKLTEVHDEFAKDLEIFSDLQGIFSDITYRRFSFSQTGKVSQYTQKVCDQCQQYPASSA